MTSLIVNIQPDSDEAALVERAKHDPTAFGTLYDRYVSRIYSYALRETRNVAQAQDVTAATFEKALRNLHRFQTRQAGFAPWLYRIARNEIFEQYRRAGRSRPLAPEGEDELAALPTDHPASEKRPIESAVVAHERDRVLYDALTRLDAADREVLALRFIEQLPTEDVAQLLNCSRNNVYVRVHRALARLRDHLAAERGETSHE